MQPLISRFLSRITPDETQQGNIWRSARTGVLVTAVATLVSVPILQVFLLSLGATEAQLGMMRFFSQLAAVGGYAAYAKAVRGLPAAGLVPAYTRLHLSQLLLPVTLLAAAGWALFGSMTTIAMLVLVTVGWMASAFYSSYYAMLMARLEALLYSPGIYGAVFGLCGILFYGVSAFLGIAVRLFMADDFSRLGYPIIFLIALGIGFGTFLSARGYVLLDAPKAASPTAAQVQTTHNPGRLHTVKIGAIHLLRGAISGIFYFIVPIGLRHYGLGSSDVGLLTMLATLGCVIASLFVLRLTDRIGVVWSSLLAEILGVASLLALAVFPQRGVFMAAYLIYNIGAAVLAQVIPIGVLYTVPQSGLAMATAVRLVAMQLADALASLGFGPVAVPFYVWILLLACVLKAAKMALISKTFGAANSIAAPKILGE